MDHWFSITPIILLWGISLLFCWSDFRLGRQRKSLPAWIFFVSGWIIQFVFLYMRGVEEGHCPIVTLAEITTFLSWALAGIYFILNLVYRSNALALYAISATTFFQALTMLLPRSSPAVEQWLHSSWLGFHAALSLLAYAAFCLSSLLAAMYLLKDRQLKNHDLTEATMTFPAITSLELWMTRALFAGFFLFSCGLLTGFFWFENLPIAKRHHDYKICWAAAVWLAYLGLILAHRFHWLRQRKAAWLYILITGLTLLSFWIINSVSTYHRF